MSVRWFGREVEARVRQQMVRNLSVAAIFVQKAARANVRPGGPSGFKTSHGGRGLYGSVINEVDPNVMAARVGSNLRYARIHELGGVITPKNAKLLAIPIHPEAKASAGPRSMSDLKLVMTGGGKGFLIRESATKTGKRQRSDIMFWLVPQATLPPRPYLRPALDNNRAQIARILATPVKG